jgi:hypothetical protein
MNAHAFHPDPRHRRGLARRVSALGLVLALAAAALPARGAIDENARPLDDVEDAFRNLTLHGEWLGFHRGAGAPRTEIPMPLVNSDQHFQGVARSPRVGGAPVLYVTRSGDVNDAGNLGSLMVVRFPSRNAEGERLRSNRLLRGVRTWDTAPPSGDRVILNIPYADYQHPGGIQMVGDVLAVPLESPKDASDPPGKIVFYDCSTPTLPRLLPFGMTFGHPVGVLGLTRLLDGHFLLVVSWGEGEEVRFFRSTGTSFFAPAFSFVEHAHVDEPDLVASGFWRTGKTTPQTLNLLPQRDGRLFLLGSSNDLETSPFFPGDDEMFLWEVTGFEEGGDLALDFIVGARKVLRSYGPPPPTWDRFGLQEANFNAAGGLHVTPTGELVYYATEYYNEGPGGCARMVELRDVRVSRRGTCGPQFRPNHLGGPYTITEGDSLVLRGRVHVVLPWIQLFRDASFRGPSVMVDQPDKFLDDNQDFKDLDGPGVVVSGEEGFNDAVSSLRACALPGWNIVLYDDDNFQEGNTPNLELPGTGSVRHVAYVGDERNDEATSVAIIPPSPLPPAPRYLWDLEDDGVFVETTLDGGASAEFSAGAGSSVNVVRMRYAGQEVTTTVEVANVPPEVVALSARGIVQEGEVVTLEGVWRDRAVGPHVITITWGDGTSETLTPLDSKEGRFTLAHVFADDSLHDVAVCVSDGEDTGCRSLPIDVRNVAPVVLAGSDLVRAEGAVVSLASASFRDAGTLDTHVATVEWGDGTTGGSLVVTESPFGPPGSTSGLTGTLAGSHVYADDGSYTVRACVTDDDGAVGCDILIVTVRNVSPVVDAGPDLVSVEARTVSLAPSVFHDAGTLDTHVATVDWGDELSPVSGLVGESPYGPPGSVAGLAGTVGSSHVYGDDGAYAVTVCVTDDDAGIGCDTLLVSVGNESPTLDLDLSGTIAFPSGARAFLGRLGVETSWSASARDAGSDDITFDWRVEDEASGEAALERTSRHCNDPSGAVCPDLDPSSWSDHFPMVVPQDVGAMTPARRGVHEVALVAADDDGGSDATSAALLVTGDDRCARGQGWWRSQAEGRGDADADLVARSVAIAAFASPSFPELLCGSSPDAACLGGAAREALSPGGADLPGDDAAGRRAKAWAAALSAWLDFAAGAVTWEAIIEPVGMPFGQLMAQVEATLVDPAATRQALGEAERMARAVNESYASPSACGHR